MGDGAFNEGLLDGTEDLFSFLAASGDNVGECSFAEGSAEEVAEKFAQTAVGKELVVTQGEGGGLQARAVLSGRAHRFRKSGGVGFAAVGAAATLCPVLADFQGDGRKVKDLSCFKVIVMRGSTERLAAVEARSVGGEVMMNNVIRHGDFLKGGTGMAFPTSGLTTRFSSQIFGFGWIGEIGLVGRRRLTAGAAVAVKLGDADFEFFESFDPVESLGNQISNGLGISLGRGNEFFTSRTFHSFVDAATKVRLSQIPE